MTTQEAQKTMNAQNRWPWTAEEKLRIIAKARL